MIGSKAMRKLNPREASKLIYTTDRPSDGQIQWVERQLKLGAIRGIRPSSTKSQWTTTAGAIAQYMAEASLPNAAGPNSGPAQRGGAELGGIYRDSLKDYFLAVIFRRKQRRVSRQFRRAVVVGQMLTLLILATVTVFSVLALLAGPAPEHTAIEAWIQQNAERFTIIQWHPAEPSADGRGVMVRVRYRYTTAHGKLITSERLFLVRGDRVVGVDSA